MKIYIITSGGESEEQEKKEFSTVFDDSFARRVVSHLKDEPTFCTGCGKKCIRCRNQYGLDFSSDIAGVLKLPDSLMYYVDDIEKYIPEKLPSFDVLIPINIHEDIILALPEFAKKAGCKAIVVPVEDPNWVSRWVREKISKTCEELSLESVFPKPFCSLQKDASHPFINEFIDYFRIGMPQLSFQVKDERIEKVEVLRSAPCGNTYYVAHNILGAKIDEELKQKVSKYWHSYPCIASMQLDPELGDTILHKGGYNHYDALNQALEELKKVKKSG